MRKHFTKDIRNFAPCQVEKARIIVYNYVMTENQSSDIEKLLPAMNVSLAQNPIQDEPADLISDEALIGIYGEVLGIIRQDRVELSDILNNFCEMVMNQGDSSSASKEAIVNLVRTKMDAADKMAKIADLMTRIRLKDKDTFPRYLSARQENTINIGDSSKRELLKRLNQAQKKIKKAT